ncbi:hypothetical protein TNIN_201291 [Trichonephila inaurata madagascariensis]|uniref:Uncharacterized protein n=1 Tax=Trichonephila inaurata madagascariensis TaxID=2747483 RepID=A0A8X6YY72_9ARAC|nr:hypothetical protein TNIN_201291 [Trichonephila inaurata madagascariensis]
MSNVHSRSSVEGWGNKITKLTAIHCFQWLKDQRKSFCNVFQLLKSGGEAAFCFVLQSSFYAAILEIKKNPKWSSLFETVDDYVADSHHNHYHDAYYGEMLKQIGFDIIYCKEEVEIDIFTSDEEYRGDVTVKWILPMFSNLDKVIALDCLQSMIETAIDKNYHPKVEYHAVNFEDGKLICASQNRIIKNLFYSICSVLPHIPAEHRQVFKDDFYQSLLDNGARNDDGAPLHRALTLEIVVQKPDFASD